LLSFQGPSLSADLQPIATGLNFLSSKFKVQVIAITLRHMSVARNTGREAPLSTLINQGLQVVPKALAMSYLGISDGVPLAHGRRAAVMVDEGPAAAARGIPYKFPVGMLKHVVDRFLAVTD
jgi:hypothetical protein